MLYRNIRASLGTANPFLLNNWVHESISDFNNCERRTAGGLCMDGKMMTRALQRGCKSYLFVKAQDYENCVASVVD
jgi:hypothetical protein